MNTELTKEVARVHTTDGGEVGVLWSPTSAPPNEGTRLYTEDQVREAVAQERASCANIAVSLSDKSREAEMIAAAIQARSSYLGQLSISAVRLDFSHP